MLASVFVPGCRSRCPSSLIVTGNRLFPPTREDWFFVVMFFFFFGRAFNSSFLTSCSFLTQVVSTVRSLCVCHTDNTKTARDAMGFVVSKAYLRCEGHFSNERGASLIAVNRNRK